MTRSRPTLRALGRHEPDELDQLADLTVRAYRELVPTGAGAYLDRLARVADRFEPGVEVVAAVLPRGRVVGGVTFVGTHAAAQAEFDDPDGAGFRHLAVDPRHRGTGTGRRLVVACLDRARALGRRRVVIHTLASMSVAAQLYADLGFRRAPSRDLTTPDGTALLACVRELDEGPDAGGRPG